MTKFIFLYIYLVSHLKYLDVEEGPVAARHAQRVRRQQELAHQRPANAQDHHYTIQAYIPTYNCYTEHHINRTKSHFNIDFVCGNYDDHTKEFNRYV